MARKFKRKIETPDEVDKIREVTAENLVKNQNLIIGVMVGILVIIGGFFGYKYFIQAPGEEKANDAMFTAEYYYSVDSFDLALNGDGQNAGFISVIGKHGGTKAGNLARYYAASCFLNLGQPEQAVQQLEKFNGKGTDFESLAAGMLAGAYAETGNKEKALAEYKKAVKHKNNITTPFYLRNASVLAHQLGKDEEAIGFEKRIKNEFPSSNQNRDTDKYLAIYGSIEADY